MSGFALRDASAKETFMTDLNKAYVSQALFDAVIVGGPRDRCSRVWEVSYHGLTHFVMIIRI